MKPWKGAVIVLVLGLLGFLIAGLMGLVGVSKKDTSNVNTSSQVVSSSSSSNALKGAVVEPKKVKDYVEEEKKTSSSSSSQKEETKTETTTSSTKEDKGDFSLSLTTEPEIVKQGKTTGFVSSKSIYRKDKTTLYTVKITLATKEFGNVEVDYFTTESDFRKVDVGTLLSITYGVDSEGYISISNASLA